MICCSYQILNPILWFQRAFNSSLISISGDTAAASLPGWTNTYQKIQLNMNLDFLRLKKLNIFMYLRQTVRLSDWFINRSLLSFIWLFCLCLFFSVCENIYSALKWPVSSWCHLYGVLLVCVSLQWTGESL